MQRSGNSSIPPELLAGAVETLRRWSKVWGTRPVAVAAAPAPMAEMTANGALAEHIASVGRLPVVELFTWQGAPPPTNTSSTPAVTQLEHAIQLNSAIQLPDGPVLLCAVTMRSGWTLTVCAALLYEAVGNNTLPLVIHRLP